jgi:glycosyltransferase involved in cell wall biosynthesis
VRSEAASLGSRVRFLGFVTDSELAYLYAHALAFVYPSLVEGFGMTIVEAMSMGVPVIASTDPAISEVASDAALLLDAHDTSAFAGAMQRIDTNPALRADLAARGKARTKQFSWDESAKQILKLFISST